MHGKGSLEWPSGIKFIGELKKKKRSGKGKLIYPNGDIYDGEFKNDT